MIDDKAFKLKRIAGRAILLTFFCGLLGWLGILNLTVIATLLLAGVFFWAVDAAST